MATTPEATHSPRELFIIGGHLVLDFANTVDDPDGPNRHDHAKAGTMTGKYGRAADLNRFRSAIRPHFIRREGDC